MGAADDPGWLVPLETTCHDPCDQEEVLPDGMEVAADCGGAVEAPDDGGEGGQGTYPCSVP